jgi:hypothetical protein
VALTEEQVRENDLRFLLDFYSLGVSVHKYTAVALYHEAQRVPFDSTIDAGNKLRIQSSLRAKIFAEAVASMETSGKWVYAIRNRHGDGIAYRYVNGGEGQAERGLRLFRRSGTDLLSALRVPPDLPLPTYFTPRVLDEMSEHLHRMYLAYLAPDAAGQETKDIVEAYRAIKHGSSLVCDPRKVSIWSGPFTIGHVWMLARWPRRNEGSAELVMKEIEMQQHSVTRDVEICRQTETVCSNLCRLIIDLLKARSLPY